MTADRNPASASKSRPKLWKTAFLVIGSFAFGGLAIALWNRRELEDIREGKNGLAGDLPSSAALPDEDIV
jgi:hypothetical protein